MRVRINHIDLVSGGRRVSFEPGLNIIAGPITTGKTTLLELCRILLSNTIDSQDLVPELRANVPYITAELLIGSRLYQMVRRLVSTTNAKVEIASNDEAWRLPVSRPDETSAMTYGQWILERLDLPQLRVPSAPTRVESDLTPVSINDYLLYCYLDQDGIDKDVLGDSHPFKNIKRQYVFRIVYGLYGIEAARIQEDLREVTGELRQLRSQASLFERFVSETPLGNRAAVIRELEAARSELVEIDEARMQSVPQDSRMRVLRDQLMDADSRIQQLRQELDNTFRSVEQLTRLENQLIAQSSRLTRTIVAESALVDFEFHVCPRCGTPVDVSRADQGTCGLCMQLPNPLKPDRDALLAEQDRIGLQIQETRGLLESRQRSIQAYQQGIEQTERDRQEISDELDSLTASFISEEAGRISYRSALRARTQERINSLEGYSAVFKKFDDVASEIERLESRRGDLDAALEQELAQANDAERSIQRLEQELDVILRQFRLPALEGDPTPRIDRRTFMPIIFGRSFEELSSLGIKVLVNVAHLLAHHRTSIELGLNLPQIVLIDGVTSNIGSEREDRLRREAVYNYLISMSDEMGSELQLIVADNDVPPFAERFVRLRLTDDNKLVRPGSDTIDGLS